MTQILRQSTEVIVVLGPFVDVGDGFTPETGVLLSTADEAEILKANTTTTTSIAAATWAAITGCDGYYGLTLTTSLTDTVGPLTVMVNDDSVCLPVLARFQVIEEALYDGIYAASAAVIPSNVTQWLGTAAATPTTAGVPEVDITYVNGNIAAASTLSKFYASITTGTADSGTTTTLTDSALTTATTDFYKGMLLVFTSGSIIGHGRLITAFTPGTDTLTFTPALPSTVGTQDYIIIPLAQADVGAWLGTVAATPTTAGVPEVDVTYWQGTTAAESSTAGTPAVDVLRFNNTTTSVSNLTRYLNATGHNALTADSGLTTTLVDAALTGADTDYYKGMMVVFSSGTIAGQCRIVTAFDAATDTLTFYPATTQAVSTNTYTLIPMAPVDNWGLLGSVMATPTVAGVPEVDLTYIAGSLVSTTTAQLGVNAVQLSGSSTVADDLEALSVGMVSGVSDSGSTTTMVDAARTEADDDYWKGAYILFTSGTISGQCRLITSFVAATDTFTFTPATTQAVSTQNYLIVPGAAVNLWGVNGAAQTATLDTIKAQTAAIEVDTAEIGAAGAGLSNINLPNQTMDIVGSITGNLSGSVGSVTGAVGSVTGLTAADVAAIKTKTDSLTFTVANKVDSNVLSVKGTTVTGSGTEASPWGP